MDVGIYFDLRNPPEWPVDPVHLYGFTLEMCEEAERLGCRSIWLSEHHRFDDSYLSQPLTFAAAVAARTRTPRIGTAIVIAPLHHPAELAEQTAIVDILSDGRVDLGLGAGYRVPEFELFGADLSRRYTTTDATVRELRRLWDGVITPGPVQERLPIWLGYQGPKGARRAGLLGEGLLCMNPQLLEPYQGGLEEAGHDPASARMAGAVEGWVTEDPEGDWPEVSRHVAYQVDSYRRRMVEGTDTPLPRPVDPDRMRARGFAGPLGGFVYGTPEEVAARIREHTAGLPTETIYFWASIGGMSDERVAEHVRLVCTRLAPLLADDGPGT